MTRHDERDQTTVHMVQRNPGVLWRRCLDGVLILAEQDEAPTFLGPPGDVIWEHIAYPTLVDDLVDDLAELFTGDRRQIEADVIEYLGLLAAQGATRKL